MGMSTVAGLTTEANDQRIRIRHSSETTRLGFDGR